MWADDLTSDQRQTVALAVGRIGEMVDGLDLDHVELVAALLSPELPRSDLLEVLRRQRTMHVEFIERMRRIQANLETITVALEGVTR